MLKKFQRLVLFLVIFSLVSIPFSFAADLEQDAVNEGTMDDIQINGNIDANDHILALDSRTCCYNPDGTECSETTMQLLVDETIDYWTGGTDSRDNANSLFDDLNDRDAEEAEELTKAQYANVYDGNCFTKTDFSVQIDNAHFYGLFNLWCTTSSQYEQSGFYLTQDVIDSDYDNIFVCYEDIWQDAEALLYKDEDGDGAAFFFDCNDNDPYVYRDLSQFGRQTDVAETDSLTQATPAICGDGKDNACLNSYDYIYPDENLHEGEQSVYGIDVDEEWSLDDDSCHRDAVACETNCLSSGEQCDYLSWDGFESGIYDYDDVNDNGIQDDDEPTIYSTEAEYEPGEGFCCGAGLIDSSSEGGYHGDIREWDRKDYACLNQELIPQDFTDYQGDPIQSDTCPDEWCWIKAEESTLKIFTMNLLGETAYDIVSDGQEWLSCRDDTGIGGYEVDIDHNFPEQSNRLYCTKEGGHYAFAECVLDRDDPNGNGQSAPISNPNSIKLRDVGDGTFALPIEDGPNDVLKSNLYQSDDGSETYSSVYTIENTLDQTIDSVGYDFLEFFVSYDGDVSLPANVQMIVKGLPIDYNSEDASEIEYFNDYVLGYAVNAPLLEAGNTIHVKVPVGEWYDVSEITFGTFQSGNDIIIENVYLSREGEAPPICTGIDNSRQNNWIADLDESNPETDVNGEYICTERYGETAWLGVSEGHDTNEVESGVGASCCGNTANEYYSGLSKKENNAACFNSEPLVSGDTAMTIEYIVDYNTFESEIVDKEVFFDYNYGIDDELGLNEIECSNENGDVEYYTFSCSEVNTYELTCTGQGLILDLKVTEGAGYTASSSHNE